MADQAKPRIQMVRKRYKGIMMMENEVEEIEKMETREDDIWLCGYPRSGTTLTAEMIYLVQTLDFDTAEKLKLDERVRIIDIKDDRFPYYKGLKYIEEMKPPRMIKTHFHHFLLPEQLQKGKGRIIYIARNPKDVVTSFFRLMQWDDLLSDNDNTFDAFVEGFIDGTEYACPWPRHVLEFWDRRNDRHVLFLKYEDAIRDMHATIRRIADFLGRDLTDEDVNKIGEHCKVDNMRNNPAVNGMYWTEIKQMNFESEGRFINKGKPGTWREVLKPEQSSKIDEMIEEVAKSGLIIEQT